MKQKISNNELFKSFSDYLPDDTLFTEEEYDIIKLKKIVFNLCQSDRNIILMYAELGNQSDLARRLGVSAATINRKIFAIRKKIIEQL